MRFQTLRQLRAFAVITCLSVHVLAADRDVVFDPELRRDSRDAPIPTRVCPTATAIECATTHYMSADDQLNVVYTLVRKRLQEMHLRAEEENLVKAQRAWIQFRDAHCRWAGEYSEPGSGLKSFRAIACMEVETVRRTYYLQPYSR
jgi:uncharacterized protein YecT (DUF1311 family)